MTTAYLPRPSDLVGLATTWGVTVILMLAGAALVGRRLPPEVQIGAGWGGLCLLLTAWGVLVPLNLAIPAAGFVFAALAVVAFRGRRPSMNAWVTLGRALLVTLPLWLILAPMRPSQPDTWLNLLPNAFYLVDWGRFPTAALPPSHSYLPAAPYNTQFLAFIGSLAWSNYPAAGMSLLNALLLLTFGLLVARALAPPPTGGLLLPWARIAGGMLLVTLFNPGFVPRFDLSAYGETALAVTSAMAAWLLVSEQGEIAANRNPSVASPAIGLILAVVVDAKQSGIGLVAASCAAAMVMSWAEGRRHLRGMLRVLGLAVLPALGLYGLWRYHVAVAGVDELQPLALGQWHWGGIPVILASAAAVVAAKGVFFGCVAAVLALLPLLLARQGWTPTTRLLAYCAALFALYNGFLLVMYVGVFPGEMSIEAHSYFRYNTHLSLVLVLALALALRDLAPAVWLQRRRTASAGVIVLGLTLVLPITFIKRLRFDLDMPQPLVWGLAKHLVPYLHDGDGLALLLPGDNDSVATMLSGVLENTPPRRRGLDLLLRNRVDTATLDEVARRGYSLALVSCTPDGLNGVPPGQAALFRREDSGWQLLAAWPYPPNAGQPRWPHALAWAPLCRAGEWAQRSRVLGEQAADLHR